MSGRIDKLLRNDYLRRMALKSIENISTKEIYGSVKEAATALGVTPKHVRLHLSGYYDHIRTNKLKYVRTQNQRLVRRMRTDLRKPVRCVETRKVYTSIASAAKRFGVSASTLGRTMKAGPYTFAFVKKRQHTGDLFK